MNLSLEDFIPEILDPEDDQFSYRLAERYEFARYGANATEKFPSPGKRFPHQDFAATFYNIYPRGLIVDQPGTGKTCLAVAIAETALKTRENDVNEGLMMMTQRIYIVGMPTVNSNFQRELVCRCTNKKYIDQDETSTTTVQKVNKAVRQNYTFMTLNDLNKFLEEHLNDESRDHELENVIFIIDEAHILVIESAELGAQFLKKKERKEVLEKLNEILLRVPSIRLIEMTGTPMRNSPNELALLLNLVLRKDLQFRTNPDEEGVDILSADRWEIWDRFKGNISYLRETKRNIKLNYLGSPINTLLNRPVKNMKNIVYPCKMEEFQRSVYYNILSTEGRSNVYSKVRQAAIIVYPDCGVSKFDTFFEKPPNLKVKDNFKELLGGNNPDPIEFIDSLANYSAKYSRIAEYIYDNPDKKGIIYQEYKFQGVFSLVALLAYGLGMEIVSANLLVELRKETGYCGAGDFDLSNLKIPKANRIAFLVPSPHMTDANREALITLYNSPANYRGEYIRWIVFSPVGREGLSFKDVTAIITDVSWSFSIDEQARRRGIRANSHDRLIAEVGENNLEIDIIQLAIDLGKENNKIPDVLETLDETVAIDEVLVSDEEETQFDDVEENDSEPDYCETSSSENINVFNIDLYMYVRAEEKERIIRPYRDLYKSMAYDAFVHRRRNQQNDLEDNSIECDFKKCRYDCYTVEIDENEERLVRVDPLKQNYKMSYEWYWSNPDEELIIELRKYLKDYFKEFNLISFTEIVNSIGSYPFELIISALIYMTEKMEVFENRLGFECFLAFSENAVALVPRPYSKFEEYLYFEDFRFQIKNNDLKPIIDTLVLSEKEDELDKIFQYTPMRAISELTRLSTAERNAVLEKAYFYENEVAEAIKEHYAPRIFTYRDLIVTTQIGIDIKNKHSLVGTLLQPKKFRILDSNIWRNPQGEEQVILEQDIAEQIKNREQFLDNTEIYGFYIVDDERGLMIYNAYKTKRPRGISCADGLNDAKKAQIFHYFNIDLNVEIPIGTTLKKMREELSNGYEIENPDDEEEIEYLYKYLLWKRRTNNTGREICNILSQELEKRGLIVYR